MLIETLACEYLNLSVALLPRLSGHVFHVTNETGYAGILESGCIRVEGTVSVSATFTPVSFGRQNGYVCFVDLRNASEEAIENFRHEYFDFLDPFVESEENVFLLLDEDKHSALIPNHVGVNTRGQAAVPELEVWYPGEVPLSAISLAIRVPMNRPDPWEVAIDKEAFARFFRESE